MIPVSKTDENTSTDRRQFLRALYGSAPDDLYFELRCIHPRTGEVRTLWGHMGDKHGLGAALKQADKLNNEEGYGVYFAPCLRREKKGNADSASWIPALWIDIDSTDTRDLEKLKAFDLAPSFILSSGGGWHAYWLLEQPFILETDADKQKVAAMLRGLFSALNGDPGYVKSVASVMRLPGSVNTKPERGGVVVSIIKSDPQRRYNLSDFAWLEGDSREERIGNMRVVTLNGNGQHPLPPRTESYLASGATKGSRNAELFAAACQMRDAGYSQPDAERELVTRYVADGNGNETPAAREKEARATIASVYQQPSREPIIAPRQQAHQQVDTLVSRYSRDAAEPEHPTVDQVREVVEACTALDPLEWAQERKRLKAICGDIFRVEDLNSMYKQARRERERSQQPELSNAPRYIETEGGMIFERITERGTTRQVVAEWNGRIIEWVIQVNDDGQSEHMMRLNLQHNAYSTTLDVPSELFGDPNALQRFIAQKAGAIYTACAGMHRHLPNAILKLSGTFPTRQTYRFMGWTLCDDKWVYVSPSLSISAAGVLTEPHEVELESRLRDYRLMESTWADSLRAFSVVIQVMPAKLAPTLIAFTLLPLIQRFLPAATAKPAIHLSGTTGSGKSEIAAMMASFYGDFARDSPPAQWGDTVNTVEALGYSLADALYWVDDYKTIYADTRTFSRLMQSYSRNMGRGRLTREAKLRQDRPCRGHLLSTGETTLEGEASVLSRMLVLDIAPWKGRDPGGEALKQAEALRQHLPGFTVHFIQWVAQQADDKGFARRLADKLVANTDDYETYLNTTLGNLAHTGRMERNWGLLVTVYQLLSDFLSERGADVLPVWQDAILETVQLVQQERAGDSFIQALNQLLASGEADITASRHPVDPKPGVTVVGYEDAQFVYLLPEIAYREVMRIHPLKFSTAAIGSQLKEDGWLIPGSSESHLTMQIRVRGRRVRVWRLKAALFRGDSGDSGDASNGDGKTTFDSV